MKTLPVGCTLTLQSRLDPGIYADDQETWENKDVTRPADAKNTRQFCRRMIYRSNYLARCYGNIGCGNTTIILHLPETHSEYDADGFDVGEALYYWWTGDGSYKHYRSVLADAILNRLDSL